ncbi:MAG: hypothetical protein E3K32_00580 [wastewater metagenome]|nr:hypothetical protein [Candidatus Loosdrechtia aerotolerans]
MREKGLEIFRSGKMYSLAARCLNGNAGISPTLLMPSMVNAALCLELLFKSMYYALNETDFKVDGRYSHDFFEIYQSLPADIRSNMSDTFDGLLSNRQMNDVNILESQYGVVIARGLEDQIKLWSSVFVKMRYVYEGHKTSMMFFPEIEETITRAILSLKPLWSSSP